MIDQLTLDRIYNSIDIVDVIGDYVSLKRRGANYLGLCPFHNEKTPSFTVSASKGIYKCFGCGKGGNAVNFLMEQEGLSFPEALKNLAKRYNIEIEEKEPSPEDIKMRDQRESMLILTQFAAEWYTKQLFDSDEGKRIGLSYFKERGFTENTIRKYELGYSPAKRDAFTNAALKKGYKIEFLTETGLTIVKEDRKFDRFAERVMFPIHSLSGQVIAFGGRIMRKDTKMAKYLNSPESEIYHKSRVLYGIYQARKEITRRNQCILVEGYTDVISLSQSGVENVVASSGTSLTPEQVKLIKRFTPNLVILYDGDPAGIKASMRGIDIVLEEEMNVKICLLPEGEDPDSFARANGAQAVKDYIESNATDFIRFKTGVLLKEAGNDPVKKAGIVSDIVKSISIIPDGITRSVYLKETAGMLDMQEKVLYDEIKKIRKKRFFKEKDKQQSRQENTTPAPNERNLISPNEPTLHQAERELIWLLLEHGETELAIDSLETLDEDDNQQMISVADFVLEDLSQDGLTFAHPVHHKILDEMMNFQVKGYAVNEKYFLNHEDSEIVKTIVDITSRNYELSKIWEIRAPEKNFEESNLTRLIERLLVEYKLQRIKEMMREHMEKLKQNQSLSTEERTEIIQEISRLSKVKTQLAAILDNRVIF
ncbi:DNA primase [Salinivirga cyanobacteriivorans]